MNIKIKVNPMTMGIAIAIVEALYLLFFLYFMGNLAPKFFGSNATIGGESYLLFMTLSFFVSTVILVGYPLSLLVHGKQREAALTVAWTVASFVVILVLLAVLGTYVFHTPYAQIPLGAGGAQ